jgi:hypothetical protein
MRFCEICKQQIEPERAEGVRDTKLCTEHARQAEKFGGEFIAVGTQSSLSKTGSLKKNYGDVGIERRRNFDGIAKLKEEFERQ